MSEGNVEAALREQADASEKATGFMGDAELIEETLAEVALLRRAADKRGCHCGSCRAANREHQRDAKRRAA